MSSYLCEMSPLQQFLAFMLGSVALIVRSVYRLYFHPLSKYPGPFLAAVSDIWYGYAWLVFRKSSPAESGCYSLHFNSNMFDLGDAVRIAPNELVFVRPEALADIYGAQHKNIELFPKTQINNHGNEERGGLIWEWDAARHRKVAKQISPAFSGRALRAKEATLHRYIDLFIQNITTHGQTDKGISLPTWLNWFCVDVSADMAYNREMNAMRDMKNPQYLDIIYGFNKFATITQVFWRFPLISPFKYLFILSAIVRPHSDIKKHSRAQLERRIRRKGAVQHLDFFEQIIPENREPPSEPREMRHLEQVAAQLLAAGFEPPCVWLYGTIYYLLLEAGCLQTLCHEIRHSFNNYDDIVAYNITSDTAASLTYLTACLQEGLRILPNTASAHGMPCISPGTTVDGTFIPRGVVCQSSTFALSRSPRNFTDPLRFCPERWLPQDHPLYDLRFTKDTLKSIRPFSQGPRACMGKEVAWSQVRLFFAKVLWKFDMELVPGQRIKLDESLRMYLMYIKPD
ncbi:cytochrome P450 [Xylaria palmicola]|nr:cytochrome P450 [Xylaria palmicola]